METDEGMYQATPQTRGRVAHESIDQKSYSTKKSDLMSLKVCSEKMGLIGQIDLYKQDQKFLIERKYRLKQLFKGQIYQLWAQYYCLIEMGYDVERLAFYEISTNKMIPIEIPSEQDRAELNRFISTFRNYTPETPITINLNKCAHCIYCNLCDKTNTENVYT